MKGAALATFFGEAHPESFRRRQSARQPYTSSMLTNTPLRRAWAVCAASMVLAGCPRDKSESDEFAVAEASQALEESALDSQAQALSSEIVEISTGFSIGGAVEAAAQELSDFVASQLPCANLTLSGSMLTVSFGVKGTGCMVHGHAITGESRITISRNDAAEVVIEHDWSELSNGVVQIDGTATVTYDAANPSRRIEHDVTVTRLRDGFMLEGEGDRTQKPLKGDLAIGFEVSGMRGWTSPRGASSLDIENVQMRWIDPVPQSGTCRLTTSRNREITLRFERKDADTITVTLAGAKRSFKFDVTQAGTMTQLE